METAAAKLEPTRQCLVTRSYSMACESEGEDGEIVPVWASGPAKGAPAVSKEMRGSPLTVEARYLPYFEVRMRLNRLVWFDR